jgi:Domain of unknown function (DUF4389)
MVLGGESTERPVHLIVNDDQTRSRLTVFFRLLLTLPHFVWLSLWGTVAFLAVVVNWIATLILGRSPSALHNFLAAYVRYAIHVAAYLSLAANPFPGFTGSPGYPIDVEIAPPARQNRWTVAFRLILAIPAMILAGALASGTVRAGNVNIGYGLLGIVAFLGWFTSLARARMPRGLRDAAVYALSYSAQLDAYLFLLTDRYPNSDPLAALEDVPVRSDPIGLHATEDNLRRSRLTVFFRFLLALPHLIWLALWGIVVYLVVIVNWFATLIRGSSPERLHRFLTAYLRYQTHVLAYLYLTANPFPGFTGREGSYPVDLSIEGPRRQNRWTVAFRAVVIIPAALVSFAYGNVLGVTAFLGWFYALATGRMPCGLLNAQELALRFSAQYNGYAYLLTDAYPYSGPSRNATPASV